MSSTLGDRLAKTELPRRILGAVLSVLVPGAGHVILGHPRVGWLVAGAALALWGAVVVSAITVQTTAFLLLGALFILAMVVNVVSVFAMPPGPRIKDGARALWPILVLLPLFRGAFYLVGLYVLTNQIAGDGAMRPAIASGDLVLIHPTRQVPPGEVALVEHPAGSGTLWLRRVETRTPERVVVSADDRSDPAAASPAADLHPDQVRGRALFVFMAARGTDGRARVWKALARPR